MPPQEKPYRVYRGGRQKGKVPLQTRPARVSARPDRRDGTEYPGPGPVTKRRRWTWGRTVVFPLVLLLLLVIAWAIGSYFSLSKGVKDANNRLPAGVSETLAHQNSLMLST